MIFDDNLKIISNLHKNLYCGEAILMSTHNIGFYEDLNYHQLSSNMHLFSSAADCY